MAKQKVVIELSIGDSKRRTKALQTAVGLCGVTSAALEGDTKLVVVGEGVDPIKMTVLLRKRLGHANIVSVGSAEEKKEEKPEEPEKPPEPCTVPPACWTPPYHHQPVYYIYDGWSW